MRLKSLNCEFLSDRDVLKLNVANVHSCEQLVAHSDLDSLSRLTQIPLKTLKLVRKYIIGQYAPFPQLGNELLSKYVKRLFIIEFGCKKIDALISNGVYSGEITEIQGAGSTGKSQLCYFLIANMLKKQPSFKCLYIDSSRNFCIKRMSQLLSPNGEENPQKLKSIQVLDCRNVFHLITVLSEMQKSNSGQNEMFLNPNLLIIDNLTRLFNVFKTSNCLEAEFYVCQIINFLNYATSYLNMAVVVVNELNSDNSGFCLNSNFWKSASSLVINLAKNEQMRVFQVVKCNRPFLDSNQTAFFRITDSAIE